mgnify:CR=1 FL=1
MLTFLNLDNVQNACALLRVFNPPAQGDTLEQALIIQIQLIELFAHVSCQRFQMLRMRRPLRLKNNMHHVVKSTNFQFYLSTDNREKASQIIDGRTKIRAGLGRKGNGVERSRLEWAKARSYCFNAWSITGIQKTRSPTRIPFVDLNSSIFIEYLLSEQSTHSGRANG